MGHDPGPWVEFRSGILRVWQDGPPGQPKRKHRNIPIHVDIPERELPGLLYGVQEALSEFLGVIYRWAELAGALELAVNLVAAIDRHFRITSPLRLPSA